MTTTRHAAVRVAVVAGAAVVLSAALPGTVVGSTTASTTAGTTISPPRAAAAPQPGRVASGAAGYCKDESGVTVVVDMSALGGGVTVRCAASSGARVNGLDALRSAGFTVTGTARFGDSFVCRIQGRPAADEVLPVPGSDGYRERCVDTPPPTAFWGYWYAPNGGAWTYSSSGAQAHATIPGGFEGWAFTLGASSPSRPAVSPVRPASSPPEPAPAPTTSPPSPTGNPPSPTGTPPSPTSTRPPPPPTSTPAPDPRPTPTPSASPPESSSSTASPRPESSAPAPAPATQSAATTPAPSSGPAAGGSSGDGDRSGAPRTATKSPPEAPSTAQPRSVATSASASEQVQVSGELPATRSENAGSALATVLGAGVLALLAVGIGLTAWRRSHRG